MTAITSHSSVPGPIKELVSLFAEQLSEVEFPGVNASALREQADAVQSTAEALANAEAVFEQARAAHAEARDVLGLSADRALAYARVYASGNEELITKLAAIPLGRRGKRVVPEPKRRAKRAPPRPQNLTELPFAKNKSERQNSGVA